MSSPVRLTFVHPTQAIEIFGNVSTPFGIRWPSTNIQVKFYGGPREPLRRAVKHKRGSRI